MSTKTYDPFAIEPNVLKLGDHGEWTLGEMHDTRLKAYDKALAAFFKVATDDAVTMKKVARSVGKLIDAVCIDASAAVDILAGLSDQKIHGEDAIGLHKLRGIVRFISEYARGEELAGNA